MGIRFKEIRGFPNYLAGSDGSIYSKKRKKYLAQEKTKDGYLKVTLYNEGKYRSRKTHRFIAEAFIDNPENKPQVNHIDGNKTNNRVENLEWCTAEENMQHAIFSGLYNEKSIKNSIESRISKYGKDHLLINLEKGRTPEVRKKLSETLKRKAKEDKQFISKLKEIQKKSQEKIQRRTVIKDINSNEIYEFTSRKEASLFLNIDPRRLSEYMKNKKLIRARFEVCNI
ncbi:MAG TPA: HNH endonuclease signature motif containing protein [Candidatus Pelethenecus sp.]|nr:HNH endonuclease signature motif containing protein [Candidatus Pelethenecus sp.]